MMLRKKNVEPSTWFNEASFTADVPTYGNVFRIASHLPWNPLLTGFN